VLSPCTPSSNPSHLRNNRTVLNFSVSPPSQGVVPLVPSQESLNAFLRMGKLPVLRLHISARSDRKSKGHKENLKKLDPKLHATFKKR
jgi:hypothetical protein